MSKVDMMVIDESHHAIADTYMRIIKRVKEANESVEIVGFTATPNRGDRKGLKDIFNNCSHQIEIGNLIREGFLVPPKTFVVVCTSSQGLWSFLLTVANTVAGTVDFVCQCP